MPLTTQTAICLIAALLLVGSNGHDCHGQSFSTPIGYTTLSIQPAWQVLSISLPKPSVLEGTILSSNSTPTARIETSLTSSSTVSALVVSKKYFLEVTGPGMPSEAEDVGHRFEVDVVTTVAANNATIYLDSGSSLNTGAVPDLTGLTFLIRPHTTLADVFGGGANPPRLTGATFMEDADEVQFYNDAGTLDAYWLYVNSSVYQWRSGNDPTDLSDHSGLAIPPGTGIIVYRQPANGNLGLVHTGDVRTTPFRIPLRAGYNFSGNPAPLDSSPFQRKMTRAHGFKGAGSGDTADQVHFLNADTIWRMFYYRANVSGSVQQWRQYGGPDPIDYMHDPSFFNDDTACLYVIQAPLPGYWIQLP